MKSSAYTPLLSIGISYWGMGGVVLPTTQKFAHFSQHEKSPLHNQIFIPFPLTPLNYNFHVITPKILHFQLYSLLLYNFYFNYIPFMYTQAMLILFLIDVQYLQNVVEKGFNSQNHSSPSDTHQVLQKSPQRNSSFSQYSLILQTSPPKSSPHSKS